MNIGRNHLLSFVALYGGRRWLKANPVDVMHAHDSAPALVANLARRGLNIPLIVTYHPAALLRNPSWKRPTWEDVQLARRLYDRTRDA